MGGKIEFGRFEGVKKEEGGNKGTCVRFPNSLWIGLGNLTKRHMQKAKYNFGQQFYLQM